MRHYPATREPARLAGLSTQLSRSNDDAAHSVTTIGALLFGTALFLAGLALGLTADAWAALPSHSDSQLSTLSPQLTSK